MSDANQFVVHVASGVATELMDDETGQTVCVALKIETKAAAAAVVAAKAN